MLQKLLLSILVFYQRYVRCFLPSACRFCPSCSEYAKQAVIKYGVLKGSSLGLKRLLRCQPLNKNSGYDPLI